MDYFQSYFLPGSGESQGHELNSLAGAGAEIGAWWLSSSYHKKWRAYAGDVRGSTPRWGQMQQEYRQGFRRLQSSRIAGPGMTAAGQRGAIRNARSDFRRMFQPSTSAKRALMGSRFFGGLGAAMLGVWLFDLGAEIMRPGLQKVQEREQRWLANEQHKDSARAFTMRQRALQAIRDSQAMMKPVIGNEASYLHT